MINKTLSQRIESAIKDTHISVTKTYQEGQFFQISEGAACYAGNHSFLNQVIGWGFHTSSLGISREIDAFINFYIKNQHSQVDIELSPYVDGCIIDILSNQGFRVNELNTISYLTLETFKPTLNPKKDFDIRIIQSTHDLKTWAQVVAKGFDAIDSENHFYHYGLSTNIYTFGCFVDQKMVSGAAVSIHNGIADLGVTSTLPRFRGQGFQKALLRKRLDFSKSHKATLATVTTAPGSISEENIQRVDFKPAYTRIKLSLEIK